MAAAAVFRGPLVAFWRPFRNMLEIEMSETAKRLKM